MVFFLKITALAYIQNISFALISRARNRDNMYYHAAASVFSSAIWFLTMKEIIINEFSIDLFIPYTFGTVAGSLTGAKVSMRIEEWLDAKADRKWKKTNKT
jgi:uncharacterized protein YebE (UPF0316 family)